MRLYIFLLYIMLFILEITSCGQLQKKEETPEDIVLAAYEAARNGNIDEYLSYFSPTMQKSIKRTISEMQEEKFSEYLIQSNAPIVGLAVSDRTDLMENVVRIRVEMVYRDKNEEQRYFLEKKQGKWKIVEVEATKQIKTIIPYGTKVFEFVPEDTTSAP